MQRFSRRRRPLFFSIMIVTVVVCLCHAAYASQLEAHDVLRDIEKPGRLSGLPGLKNFGVVEKGVYRGAQPAAEGYATLKRMGVKSVLNLRSDKDEKAAVEAAGMKQLEVPMGMLRHVDRESVDKAVSLIADPANRPVFVHCMLGEDRTGVVIAAYRMEVDGWALPEAEKEMQSFGFNDVWVNLKHLIHKLAADIGKTR